VKFYIASSFENHRVAALYGAAFVAAGCLWTFDWTVYHPSRRPPDTDVPRIAQRELSAIKAADVLVLLYPARYGSHTELGIALGSRKPVIAVGGHLAQKNAHTTLPFLWLPQVTRVARDPEKWFDQGGVQTLLTLMEAVAPPAPS
jgi:hypothetical protein